MPDNFVGDFNISVQGASNPTLGAGGQGVCGVNINFDHEYLGDLSITLTSPSGQSVQLVGPIGFFGPTDGTTWNVSFVPCGDPVMPDAGFASTWQNNQAWGLNRSYSGTYYPASGCLQNFNSGPVNGTWSLTVNDGQAIDVGNFYNYEIIFCDPSGINCFSCAANAGNISGANVTACVGSPTLNLNLTPIYSPPNSVQPPAGQYSYTYVIGGAGGVIQNYEAVPDLTSYPAGNYTVCGLSYLTAEAGNLPAPGSMTVFDLNNALASGQPPFCGDMTPTCVSVTINGGPADSEVTETICAPDCFVFNGTTYCASGDYVRMLTQNGCPYTATLHLTVVSVPPTNLSETICEGDCAQTPGFASACTGGTHTRTLQSYLGCDSVINLNLTVIEADVSIDPPQEFACGQSFMDLYGIVSASGAANYTWSATNGGSIVGPVSNADVRVSGPGTYTLEACVTSNGVTCCDMATVTVVEGANPPVAPDFITGPDVLCTGEIANFTAATVPGNGTYLWTVPPGVLINFGQGTPNINVTWNTMSVSSICVTYNNACGTSPATCLQINLQTPSVPTQPIGSTNACTNITEDYSTTFDPNVFDYIWTVTAPSTIISGQGSSSISVNWGNISNGSVCVRTVSSCGTSQPVCLPVQISSLPTDPNLTGSSGGCAGSTSNYSVAAVNGATSYNWQITGGTITSGGTGTNVTVTWDPTTIVGSVCVSAVNSCGESGQDCLNVLLDPAPGQPLISGNNTACAGTTAMYSIAPVNGATGYTWSVSGGGSIISGQNTTQVNVRWLTAPGGNVCVTATGFCGSGPQFCLPVGVSIQPVSNAGNGGTVCGSSFNLQATPSVAGSSGLWILVPGAPGQVSFANPNSASTTVTVTTGGIYRFVWEEQLNTCTSDDSLTVVFSSPPVTGQITQTCDGTNQNYVVSFPITNGTAPYTVPGGTVSGGVFTSNPIPSGNTYSFQVTDANGCQSTVVTGSFSCLCSTSAGTMSLAPLSACQGSSVTGTHNGGQVLDANDVSAYVLHTGSGTTLGTVLGQNATGTFGFQAGMTYETTYYISFVVGNNLNGAPNPADPCFSVAQGQPVVWHQNPVANAGTDDSTCGLSLTLTGTAGTGTSSWSVVSNPAGGTLSLSNAQSPVAVATASIFGTYTLQWVVDNLGCRDTDLVVLNFNSSPLPGQITRTCDNTNQNYTVSFPVTGGTAPYTIAGGTITNGVFTSNPIVSGQSYSFQVTDANGCQSNAVTGSFSCSCGTSAGTMSLTALSVCEGNSATATHTGGEILDANDVSAYILHTGSSTTLGTVLGQNTTGTFSFQTGMVYGTTYYVSFAVGNNLNGQPNPADPCFSVAQGQPVVWRQNPVANAGTDASTCGLSQSLNGSTSPGTTAWSVVSSPNGGTLTFDNAQSPTATATASIFGAYTLQWAIDNQGCRDSDVVVLNFNSAPLPGQITRDCGGSNQNYTVTFPITGGTAPYTVTGGTVTNGVFTSGLIVSGQSYSFQVTDANGCQSAVVTGSFDCSCVTSAGTMSLTALSVCADNSATATHTGDQMLDGNDVTAYALHTGSGTTLGTVLSQNTTGIFSFQNGMAYETTYYISFIAGNPLNGQPDPADPCFSVAQGQPVVWHQNPVANAGTDADICGLVLPLTGNTGTGTGIWSVVSNPAGGTLSIGDSQNAATTATASGAGTYVLAWTIDNSGCTDADTVQLTFNSAPVSGQVTTSCDASNQNYTVSIPLSGGTAPYQVNSTPVTGNTFTSASIASGTTYTFTISDANGCTTTDVTGSFACNCSTQAGNMDTTALSTCEGGTITATHLGGETLDGNDVRAYVLHTGSGTTLGTVLSQNTTGTFSFQNGMTYGTTYYVSFVVGNNLNGQPDPTDPCFAVAVGEPVVWYQNPVANAGVDADTCGLTLALNGSNAGSGQWTISSAPNGATLLFADDQDPQSEVTASAAGTYSLIWTVSANGCISNDQVDLQFNSSPSLADLVRTCDAANENFTVTLTLTGGTPPYSINGTVAADSSFTSAALTNGQTYSFNISDANGCVAPVVNGAYSCNCATDAGTMDAATLTACETDPVTVTANNDQSLDGNDITAYVLHNGAGPALGSVLAQNTTGIFSFQNGMTFGQTYHVSLVAGNPLNGQPNPLDPCFSVAIGQPVVWLQNPTPDAGTDTSVCGTTIALQAAGGGFGGVWSQVSGPDTTIFSSAASANSGITITMSGTYVYRWTETNGICTAFDDVTISFTTVPVVDALEETCDGTNTQFTVTFTVTGGTAPYTVNGLTGTFSGSNFTSTALNNSGNYSFNIVDANGCASGQISGSKNCNCATDAGSMVSTPATFCADQPAVAIWNDDATLDANDTLLFILHSISSTTVGTVYAVGSEPSFPFTNDLQPGVVYYISAIAGNNVNGAVELSDECLSVTPGAPVQWKLLPTATLAGDATICTGGSSFLSFSGTGTFPLQLSYTNQYGDSSAITLTGSQTVTLGVMPTVTTTYTLTNVVDGTLPACSASLNETATVQVNSTITAGTAEATSFLCSGTSQTVQLSQQLIGADPGGVWTETSAVPSTGTAFNAAAAAFNTTAQAPGTYTFRYRIDAAAPCNDAEATVTVVISPTPTADAGPDKTLDCNTSSAILGGVNTTAGTGVAYQWLLDTAVVGNSRTLTTTAGGIYTLVVSSATGECSATDRVAVTLDADLPSAQFFVRDVRCFGDKNGSISVDSVISSHLPVLFSLNGGAFGPNGNFSPLPPGEYTVAIQDANGCEWNSDTMTVNEPSQLVVNLGPDLNLSLGDVARVDLQLSDSLTSLDTIIWRPLLDSTAVGQSYQEWLPTESRPLSVQVVDNNGCMADDRLLIVLNKVRHIYIPNIIQPGVTGNDIITVFGGPDVAEVETFRIYDRWGEQLFELLNFQPNNVSDGWGGRYRNKEVAPAVYAYYVVVRFKDGEREVFAGDVTVLR